MLLARRPYLSARDGGKTQLWALDLTNGGEAVQITVFDSSGIAIQDLGVAGAIFEAAQKMGQVKHIDF